MLPVLAWIAWGCSAASAPGPSAAERAAAVAAGDAEACASLVDPEEAGACVALGADRVARAGDVERAWAACQGLAAGLWRDECHFLVTDAAGVVGEEAKAWCQHAGRFRLRCVGHALSREAQPLLSAAPRGEEARMGEELVALTARYLGAAQAPQKAHQLLVDHLAQRDPGAPFHAGLCGSAPGAACRDAYIERVKRAAEGPGEPWRAACGRSVSVERARGAGVPLWSPDADAIVAEAWVRLCAR